MTFLPAAEPRLVPLLPKGVALPRVPLLDHLHSPPAPFGARAVCSPPSDAPETPAGASELCDARAWRRSTGVKRAGSSDSEDGASPGRKRAKPHKWRKPTYLVRKVRVYGLRAGIAGEVEADEGFYERQEERDVLLGEIRALEAKVQLLRRHAGLAPSCVNIGGGLPTLVDTELHNNLLRESMRNQQLQLLSAQSAISELAMVRAAAGRGRIMIMTHMTNAESLCDSIRSPSTARWRRPSSSDETGTSAATRSWRSRTPSCETRGCFWRSAHSS